MAGRFPSVPEDSTAGITAPYPPSNSYRELIRSVAWPHWQIGSALSSQSGQSGSSYSSISGASSSYLSNISAGAADFGAEELSGIARRMMSDGYTQRMVKEFGDAADQDRTLKNWFVELDVDWVLEIRGGFGLRRQIQLLLQNTSSSWQQELIERWIRALTVIVLSISKDVDSDVHPTLTAARFVKASISAMLAVVAPILDILKVEKIQAVLHMYICVSSALYDLGVMHVVSSEAQSIFKEIGALLEREQNRLIGTISISLSEMRMSLIGGDDDDSWAIGIGRGGGEVHTKTRVLVGNIVLMKKAMRKAHASVQNSTQSHEAESLRRLINGMIGYTTDLLLSKSELCLDSRLRYMFLLNNSYFVEQEVTEPSVSLYVGLGPRLRLTPECKQYMNSYLDVSWGHVLSWISDTRYSNHYLLGATKYQRKTAALATFQSAFHQVYQAQKFWKVPDPHLRSLLRETIAKRVISGYRDYLKKHPELEKHASSGSNSPEVMEEMLGQIFEG